MAMLNVDPKTTPGNVLNTGDVVAPVDQSTGGTIFTTGGGGYTGIPVKPTVETKLPVTYIQPPAEKFPEKPVPRLPIVPIVPPYNPPARPPATLDAVVTLSKTSAERTYIKGSMRSISNDYIVATNTSTTLTVTVKFTGVAGITFEPTQFNLAPLEQKNIIVSFNPVEIEKLPEGTSEIITIIDIATISAIEEPMIIYPPKLDIIPPVITPKIEKPTFMGGTYDWTTNTLGGGGSLSRPDKSVDAI